MTSPTKTPCPVRQSRSARRGTGRLRWWATSALLLAAALPAAAFPHQNDLQSQAPELGGASARSVASATGARAGDPSADLQHAAGLAREGKLDEALALYRRLARAHPRSEAPRLAAGNALREAGRLKEAIVEFEAAARLAERPTPVLVGLARLYLDPQVRRPTDALTVLRVAKRLEPWREESHYLVARAYEGLGEHEAARQAYRTLLTSFPAGRYRDRARRGLDGLTRSFYAVTLSFRFQNRGLKPAQNIRFRVQAAESFPPYSEVRLSDVPFGIEGKALADGTRYLSFGPFGLKQGEERSVRIRYAVSVAAEAYAGAGGTPEPAVLRQFLAASPFVESDAPEITSLAETLAPSGATRERARRFYDFVVKRLTYVVQAETQGALGALANPHQADCTEFAALFIALARAGGIPARPVFGYLYEPEKARYEISHLWAEFWDEEAGWVSVDPTNGTLEPDRYFARVESNYIPLWVPSPAFGDLAGVRVSYQSPGEDDTLFTELVTEIERIAPAEFDAVQDQALSFGAGDQDLEGRGSESPFLPAVALFAAALGLRFWQKRSRPV